MNFKELSEIWLENKKFCVKTSTYTLYVYEVRYYLQRLLGQIELHEITDILLQKTMLEFQQENNQKLSIKTINNINILLTQIIKFGQKNNFMNNFEFIIKLNRNYTINNYNFILNDKDLRHLISFIHSKPTFKSLGILLAINEGLRIGEVCALCWKDFDFKNNLIYINKTLQRITLPDPVNGKRTKIIITSCKTHSSIRVIPISNEVKYVISKLKNSIDEKLFLYPDNYVLTNSPNYMEPRSLRKYYSGFCKSNNINGLKFHSLRHTFATKCIEQGTDCKIVSEILGHSTVNTTLNLYVHPSMKDKRKCLDKLKF